MTFAHTFNTVLGDVINDWSLNCQHNSDAELARFLKRIDQLRSNLSGAMVAYADAFEADEVSTPTV